MLAKGLIFLLAATVIALFCAADEGDDGKDEMALLQQAGGYGASDELDALPLLSRGITRLSSHDRDGGDEDFFQLAAGNSLVLADIKGSGTIKRLYIKVDSDDPVHLRSMVLRFYWDNSRDPCVECPLGDFFALGHGRYARVNSVPIVTGHKRGMTCYFPMPFYKRALMVLVNEGRGIQNRIFYQIDYQKGPPAGGAGLFHAQYAQGMMTRSDGNYVVAHAKGRGKYVGTVLSVVCGEDGAFWEGDEKFFIDGEEFPAVQGTGLDDYFGGAWGFEQGFSAHYFGTPVVDGTGKGSEFTGYRFHIRDPISFSKELILSIEHRGVRMMDGRSLGVSSRREQYFSVAYWYQTPSHKQFTAIPYVAERISGSRHHVREAEMLEVVESTEDPISYDVLDGETVILFNADEEGDSLTFRTIVAVSGEYEIAGSFLRSRRGGIYSLTVNGTVLGPQQDFFNDRGGQGRDCRLVDDKVLFGRITLQAGTAVLRFRVDGNNELSEGFLLGIDNLSLRPVR